VTSACETFRRLLALCEHPEPLITGKVLRENYGTHAALLLETGALERGSPLSHLSITIDDHHEYEVEIERNEKGRPGYRSPRTGQWRTVPESDLLQYRLNAQALLTKIATELDIRERFQTVELVPNLLWELGEARFGKRVAVVLFARRLTEVDHIDRICDRLVNRVGKSDGVLLTSTRNIPRHFEVPGRHRICSLHDCFNSISSPLLLDHTVLHGLFHATQPRLSVVGPRVQCALDGSSLVVHKKRYAFKGAKQKAIIRLLYQAWENGEPRQKTSDILYKAGSQADQLKQAFSGCQTAWQEVVEYGEGYCWLKVEEM
jgi:hypothetical protein